MKKIILFSVIALFLSATIVSCEKDEKKNNKCNNNVVVPFFEANLTIPCTYSYETNSGDDSYWFSISSKSGDVVLGYERNFYYQPDTIWKLPLILYNRFNIKTVIKDKNNMELGVLFSRKVKTIHFDGVFLIKKKSYYLEFMGLSYSENKTNEVIEILSTLTLKNK